jgi:16S rRNA (guanine966-N2)-methyltransferase
VKGGRAPRGGDVRIIAGEWRSRRIAFSDAPGLRPTPDRVRETLFNWLGHNLAGFRCLDLYAGSGALGFEALSRGAERVLMVERNPAAVRALAENARQLQAARLEIVRADALEFLRLARRRGGQVNGSCGAGEAATAMRFDVVFLDPPFADGLSAGVLAMLPELLADGGRVYVESGRLPELPSSWKVEKRGRAGQVSFQLMRWEPE